MLSNGKFRKALGFRAFVCVILGFTVFSSAPAQSQVAPKNPAEGKAACEQELNDRFTFMEGLDGDKKVSPEKVDQSFLAENCKMNVQSGVNIKNGVRESSETRGLALATDAAGVKYLGACELSHISVKKHFETLKKKYLEYCEYVETASSELAGCDGVSSKSNVTDCLNKLARTERTLKEKFVAVNKYLEKAKGDLEKFQKTNETIANEFDRDRAQLTNPNPQMTAAAGFENKMDEYKAALMPDSHVSAAVKGGSPETEGALIAEQRLAHNNVERYLKNIEEFKVEKHALSDQLAEQEEKLKKLKDDMKSDGSSLGNYASTAAAAAPAAQSLMGKNGSTASSSSGPGISGAVAALPAAAALIGAAKGNSGASSASPTPSGGSAPSSHETPTTALGGTAVAAGNRAPASNNNTEPKTNATEAKKEETTGGFTPMNLSSDGSSRMGTVKKGAKATEENSGPAQATSYANNGVDAGGGMSLNSHGGSHSNTPAPGTEVTNLLGQMKSLFNFDDPAGTGGGNGGGVFGGAMPAMAPGMPGSGETAQAGAYSENGTYNPEAVASNGEASTVEQGAVPDNQSDSLFVRVHKRHRRAEERGMVRGV